MHLDWPTEWTSKGNQPVGEGEISRLAEGRMSGPAVEEARWDSFAASEV
jgi:hypothetical protein